MALYKSLNNKCRTRYASVHCMLHNEILTHTCIPPFTEEFQTFDVMHEEITWFSTNFLTWILKNVQTLKKMLNIS